MTQRFTPTAEQLTLRGDPQRAFHEKAAQTARTHFGRRVFVRAVVEVSNFCRENCTYCGMRRDNRGLSRFRANADALAELLLNHRPASVTDINIQAGEDPVAVREVVLPLLRTLRRETDLGLSVCLGSLSPEIYAELKSAGASIYIIKFEIADPARYAATQAPRRYEERLANIRHLAATGWRVSSGFIAGLPGQTETDMLENLSLASNLPLAGCSVSPFIPGDETPLASERSGGAELTLNCMAAMRLLRPDWVIPSVSALNLVAPQDGYRRGLGTGANLVTINLTPPDVRGNYLLYKRDRFIMTEERILKAISDAGLVASEQSLAEFWNSKAAANRTKVAEVIA